MSRPYYDPNPVSGPEQYTNAEYTLKEPWKEQAKGLRLVGHSDLNGWGDAFQIKVIKGGICYVAASGINGNDGITILDVKDPRKPKVLNQMRDGEAARTHKVVPINDEIMITNSELRVGMKEKHPEAKGGLRVLDISDPVNPKLIRYAETDGRGIHRPIYDPRRKLVYSSGFKNGCKERILLIHDLKEPTRPELIGEFWLEGQMEGEAPSWDPKNVRSQACHEAHPLGDYLTCTWWDAGVSLIDLKDPTKPKLVWRHSPHETHGWAGANHTFVVPEGSEFGVVAQETVVVNCVHPPAHVTFYDMRNIMKPQVASTFMPYDIDPATMRPRDDKWCKTGSRYGAHNLWHGMKADDLLYVCWFNAGLRVVDWSNPFAPKEVAYYIPAGNKERAVPQSNDCFVDRDTGLIYVSDRWGLGLHILEHTN
jgi:hypothetical protein